MSRGQIVLHLCVGLTVVPFLWLSDDWSFLATLCLVDVISFTLLLAQALRHKSANLFSPALWAILGYLIFGQIPVIVNVFFDPSSYDGYNSVPLMIRLIVTGYRAVLAGILLYLPKRPDRARSTFLQLPSKNIALTVVIIGVLARVLIRNNIFATSIDEIAWYHSFAFACAPIGTALPIARAGQYKNESRSLTFLFTILLAVSAALVDVSRKETGCILLPIVLFFAFKAVPQFPVLVPTMSRAMRTAVLLLAMGALLMATRALSWASSNGTDLASEFQVSMQGRRANDMTNMLAFVLDASPVSYPFLHGVTVGSLLPIPRILWPDRPPAHSYIVGLQVRGMSDLAYKRELTGNRQLSISAHMLGEGYANFGPPGALLFEFIFGAVVGFYERQLHRGKLTTLRILFPVILFFIFTQQRGDLAMMNNEWMMCAAMLCGILSLNRWIIGSGTEQICRYPLHQTFPVRFA